MILGNFKLISKLKIVYKVEKLELCQHTVHRRDGEVSLSHLFGQPVDLATRVAKDNRLGDCERVVEIAESVEFPLFSFNGNKELLDAFQGQLITVQIERKNYLD